MKLSRTLVALLAAEVVSSTGTAMTFVALPWFVLVTSGSATKMSVVLAAEVVPMALFGIPSGSLVGRLGARTTMLVSDAIRTPLIVLVPLLHWTGHLSFGGLIAIVFALGCFTAPYISAQRTIIPELFGDDEKTVAKASGLFGGATQLPIVIGPAIAGVLIAFFGAPALLSSTARRSSSRSSLFSRWSRPAGGYRSMRNIGACSRAFATSRGTGSSGRCR